MSLGPRFLAESSMNPRTVIESHVRECYGRVAYSHKTQEKCVDLLLGRLRTIKLLQLVLSSITTAGFLGAILGAGQASAVLGVGVSTLLLALNAYTQDHDLGELAERHRQAASALWRIRETYLSLLTDLRVGSDALGDLTKRRDELLKELDGVYSGAPATNYKAYKKAREALRRHEELTFSDSEIDALLPSELRKTAGTARCSA